MTRARSLRALLVFRALLRAKTAALVVTARQCAIRMQHATVTQIVVGLTTLSMEHPALVSVTLPLVLAEIKLRVSATLEHLALTATWNSTHCTGQTSLLAFMPMTQAPCQLKISTTITPPVQVRRFLQIGVV